MLRETVFVIAALFVLANSTEVNQCSEGDANQVQISDCEEPPCKLKRKTHVAIQQVFTPEWDIQSLTASVHAKILGVPLPFIGVDGTDACEQIYTTDGTKAGCPLKKGNTYLYKNSFPILQSYPPVSLEVHYALVEAGKTVTCFEVPSKIVN